MLGALPSKPTSGSMPGEARGQSRSRSRGKKPSKSRSPPRPRPPKPTANAEAKVPGAAKERIGMDDHPEQRVVNTENSVVKNFVFGEADQEDLPPGLKVHKNAPEPLKKPNAYNWVFKVGDGRFAHVRAGGTEAPNDLSAEKFKNNKCDACGTRCKVLYVARCYPKRTFRADEKAMKLDEARVHFDVRATRTLRPEIMYLGSVCGQKYCGAALPSERKGGEVAADGEENDGDNDEEEEEEDDGDEDEGGGDGVAGEAGNKRVSKIGRTATGAEVSHFLALGKQHHAARVSAWAVKRETATNACERALEEAAAARDEARAQEGVACAAEEDAKQFLEEQKELRDEKLLTADWLTKIDGYCKLVHERFLVGDEAAKKAQQANAAFAAAKAKATLNKLHADDEVKKKIETFFDNEPHNEPHQYNTYVACERAQNARDKLNKLNDLGHKFNAQARMDMPPQSKG